MQPYSVVENPGCTHLDISMLEPCHQMPSRLHLTTKVLPSMYDDVKEKVIGEDLSEVLSDVVVKCTLQLQKKSYCCIYIVI